LHRLCFESQLYMIGFTRAEFVVFQNEYKGNE
jgi:hypothetical protein